MAKRIEPEDRELRESDFWIFWNLWFQEEWDPSEDEGFQDVVTLTSLGYLWADGNDPESGLVVGLTDKARMLLEEMLNYALAKSSQDKAKAGANQ